jgi:hypothetical protein
MSETVVDPIRQEAREELAWERRETESLRRSTERVPSGTVPIAGFGLAKWAWMARAKLARAAVPLILRDVCELPPASELDLDAITISRDDLERILRLHLEGKE